MIDNLTFKVNAATLQMNKCLTSKGTVLTSWVIFFTPEVIDLTFEVNMQVLNPQVKI